MADTKRDSRGKPYLSILFECCRVYQRVYKNKDGDAYEGRCPKCLKKVRVPIGAEGVNQRFFKAY